MLSSWIYKSEFIDSWEQAQARSCNDLETNFNALYEKNYLNLCANRQKKNF